MKYFSTSEGINGARLPHFGRQTPPGLCRIDAPLYMAQVIGRHGLFGKCSRANRHNLVRGISVYFFPLGELSSKAHLTGRDNHTLKSRENNELDSRPANPFLDTDLVIEQ